MNDEKLLHNQNLGKDEILELLRCALNKSGMLRAVGRVTSWRSMRLAVLVAKGYLQVKNPAHIHNLEYYPNLKPTLERQAVLTLTDAGKAVVLALSPADYAGNDWYPLPRDIQKAHENLGGKTE